MTTKNALIQSVTLGYEDHGILTCYLTLWYGDSSGQGFGGYALDAFNKEVGERFGTAYGMEFIKSILDTVGVKAWEDLPGRNIRVKAENNKVYAIGNIIEDTWFEPKKDLIPGDEK